MSAIKFISKFTQILIFNTNWDALIENIDLSLRLFGKEENFFFLLFLSLRHDYELKIRRLFIIQISLFYTIENFV